MKSFNIGDEVEDFTGHRSFVIGWKLECDDVSDNFEGNLQVINIVNNVVYQTVDVENRHHNYHADELILVKKDEPKLFKFSIGDTVTKTNGYPNPIIFEIKDRFMVNKCYPYYKIRNIHPTIPDNYEYVPEHILKSTPKAWTGAVTCHHMYTAADIYPKNEKIYSELEPKFKVGDIVADLYLGIITNIDNKGYYVRFGSPVNKTVLYGLNNPALHIPADYEVDKWIKRTFKDEEVCQNPDTEEPIQKGFYYVRNTGTELDGYQCQILKYDTSGRTKVKIPAFDNLALWVDSKHVKFQRS